MPFHPSNALPASPGWETCPQSVEISAWLSAGGFGCSRLAGHCRGSLSVSCSPRCESRLFGRARGLVFGCRWMASGTGWMVVIAMPQACVFWGQLFLLFLPARPDPIPPGRCRLGGDDRAALGVGRELTLVSLPGPQKRRPMSPWRLNLVEGAEMMGSSRSCGRSVVRRSQPLRLEGQSRRSWRCAAIRQVEVVWPRERRDLGGVGHSPLRLPDREASSNSWAPLGLHVGVSVWM